MFSTATRELDGETLAYLQMIQESRGKEGDGVFVPLGPRASSPRTGQVFLVLLGVGLLALAGVLGLAVNGSGRGFGELQALFLAVGIGLLLVGILGLRRKVFHSPLEKFFWIDAGYAWWVEPHRVIAIPAEELELVRGTHHIRNGWYQHTEVEIRHREGWRSLTLDSKKLAERMICFANFVRLAHRSDGETRLRTLREVPELLGALASRVARGGPEVLMEKDALARLSPGPVIPVPYRDEAAAEEYAVPLKEYCLAWVLAASVCMVGWVALPWYHAVRYEKELFAATQSAGSGDEHPFTNYLQAFSAGHRSEQVRAAYEENLYQFARAGSETDVSSCERYLAAHREGAHADEVRGLLDDRRFAVACAESGRDKDPAPLRRYRDGGSDGKHRPEAQERIAALYDRELKALADRAAGSKTAIDRPLFEAMTALLEGLKQAPSSDVTVAFQGTQEDAPERSFNVTEGLSYQIHLSQIAELKAMHDRQGTAILPRGKVFDPDQTRRRESLVMDRFEAAVARVISKKLLHLRRVEGDDRPTLTVHYHAVPRGRLYVYQQERWEESGGRRTSHEKTARGLLRGYDMLWTIHVRPAGAEKPIEVKLASNPAESMRYHSSPADPDWAPYAILLHSAFYDMSNRFIVNFGLDPGPVPTGYSFTDATGIELRRPRFGDSDDRPDWNPTTDDDDDHMARDRRTTVSRRRRR